jgi:hypothetical protein
VLRRQLLSLPAPALVNNNHINTIVSYFTLAFWPSVCHSLRNDFTGSRMFTPTGIFLPTAVSYNISPTVSYGTVVEYSPYKQVTRVRNPGCQVKILFHWFFYPLPVDDIDGFEPGHVIMFDLLGCGQGACKVLFCILKSLKSLVSAPQDA